MVLKTKQKGSDFERLAVKLLTDKVKKSSWRKMPTSGAMGTTLNEPILTGDVSGTIESFPKKFKIECKVGYGGKTQFALKKEWLDKIKKEAENFYSIPVLLGKFSGARDGVQVFAVLDIDTFTDLLNYVTELREDLEERDREESLL